MRCGYDCLTGNEGGLQGAGVIARSAAPPGQFRLLARDWYGLFPRLD